MHSTCTMQMKLYNYRAVIIYNNYNDYCRNMLIKYILNNTNAANIHINFVC